MSTWTRNFGSLLSAALAVLLLCGISSHASAHHHHNHHGGAHGHAMHQKAAAAEHVTKSSHKNRGQHEQRHHAGHSRHHGGKCPAPVVCNCGGAGCCGFHDDNALARSGAKRWQIVSVCSWHEPKSPRFPIYQPASEPPDRKRRDWPIALEPSASGWRAKLYAESPRLRI